MKNTLQSDRPEDSVLPLADCISLINFISLHPQFSHPNNEAILPSSWRSSEATDGQAVRTAETDEGSACWLSSLEVRFSFSRPENIIGSSGAFWPVQRGCDLNVTKATRAMFFCVVWIRGLAQSGSEWCLSAGLDGKV